MEKKVYSLGEETEQIEFKKSTSEIKEAIISIASILNKHQSGTIYFGVKNDGTIIGQDIADDTLRTISQAVRYHISPIIYPDIKKEIYGEKSVVVVKFQGN